MSEKIKKALQEEVIRETPKKEIFVEVLSKKSKKVETKNTKKEIATQENPNLKQPKEIAKAVVKPEVKKQSDMNELIKVVCITNTPLIYESKSQLGYRVEWGGYLEENWMEYKELINMRGAQRRFFEEPWIICEWDVLTDLRVDHYYKNIIDLENIDQLFYSNPDKLTKTLQVVPNGIKKLILDRAFELRRKKELDSLSIIEAIENTLNVDLSV